VEHVLVQGAINIHMQQFEMMPVSDSLNIIMELLLIKFNSIHVPLLNADELTFMLNFTCNL